MTLNPVLWHTLENRWSIRGRLVAQTGLRVGAGAQTIEPTATDLPVLRTADGTPYIPGSSLRGVLRSAIERIVRTLEGSPAHPVGGWDGRSACDPTDEEAWCVPASVVEELRKDLRDQADRSRVLAERILSRSCRVCRVFGSPWLASRVRIMDLPALNVRTPEIRPGVAIDRDKETVANLFDFEVLPAGTAFQMEIIAENLSEAERGLVWLGLRELMQGTISVGGFKGRGLGKVVLEGLEMKFLDARRKDALRDYLLKGQVPSLDPKQADSWLRACLRSMDLDVEGDDA